MVMVSLVTPWCVTPPLSPANAGTQTGALLLGILIRPVAGSQFATSWPGASCVLAALVVPPVVAAPPVRPVVLAPLTVPPAATSVVAAGPDGPASPDGAAAAPPARPGVLAGPCRPVSTDF